MSEPRYIDINCPEMVHLVANLEPRWKPMAEFDGNDFNELNSIVEALDTVPTADVAEVKHGRWAIFSEVHDGYYYCSNCYSDSRAAQYRLYRRYSAKPSSAYCPDCGASMDL